MLVLKIVFGIIVSLPILFLAEFLFERTVEDAVIGTTSKKKKKPLIQRLFPGLGKRKEKKRKDRKKSSSGDINE